MFTSLWLKSLTIGIGLVIPPVRIIESRPFHIQTSQPSNNQRENRGLNWKNNNFQLYGREYWTNVAFNPQSRRRHLNKLKKVCEMKRYSTQIWKYNILLRTYYIWYAQLRVQHVCCRSAVLLLCLIEVNKEAADRTGGSWCFLCVFVSVCASVNVLLALFIRVCLSEVKSL